MLESGSDSVDTLITLGSPALVSTDPASAWVDGPRQTELLDLLQRKNGFYAFESALHVLPAAQNSRECMTLEAWNDLTLWKGEFDGLAEGLFCFAEDVFGVQFAVAGRAIVTFDPETGATQEMAESLDAWGRHGPRSVSTADWLSTRSRMATPTRRAESWVPATSKGSICVWGQILVGELVRKRGGHRDEGAGRYCSSDSRST